MLNRLTQSQRPISSTNSTLQTTTIAYAGRTTTVIDPLSNTKSVVQDVNGWLRRTTDPYNYYVALGYDAAGNKTSATDSLSNPLWSGAYAYGASAFLTSMTDMDLGSWSFTRDALGEKTGWTDAKGQTFTETYDALSRPLTRTEPDLYTSWTWGSTPSAHNVGKLASVCTGTASNPTNCTATPGYAEAETYDADGRLSQRAITLPSVGTFTYTWAYNATTGLLNTLTYPASYPSTYSLQVQYAYSNGVLQSVTDVSDTPNVTVWTANTTNPAGQVTEETLGNGIVTNRSFDAVTGWLGSDQSGVGGGATVKNLSFLYDDMGDVTQRQDNNLGLTENAFYDNDYRLSYTQLNGTQNLSLTYDVTGNITSRSDIASGAAWTYSTTKKHAVTLAGSSAYNYSYDANGNATARQGYYPTWTSYNYMGSVYAGSGSTEERVDFNYGPDRKRWSETYYTYSPSSYETTDYIGGLFERVIGSAITGTIYRYYIYAGSEPIAVYARTSTGTNTFNYMLSDHQGSVSDLTSSTGTSTVNESFTPYGMRRNPATWSGAASNSDLTTAAGITRQAYTFQTQMGLWMGLNHMNGRVEDSMIGRFLSADPHIPDPTNTQSYNRYSYVNNNPLTLVDPTGFDNKKCPPEGCPGGVAGMPEQSGWSCYEDCGLGYANTYGTVTTPGQAPILFAGSPAGALDQAYSLASSSAAFAAAGNAFGQQLNSIMGAYAPSGSAAQGSQQQGNFEFNAPPIGFGYLGTYGPAGLTGNFACGSFQCSYQMGPFSNGDLSGAWIRVNLSGGFGDGSWVQSWSTSMNQSGMDTPATYPFYPSSSSGGLYFEDAPARFFAQSVTWAAQTSYVQPYQNGAAFTFQWGFTLSNGSVSYIAPALAVPWPYQQQLISAAQWWLKQ